MSRAASTEGPSPPQSAPILKDSDFNWEDPLGLEAELTEVSTPKASCAGLGKDNI